MKPDIKFSDFALRGLEKVFPDREKRISAKQAIEWYVKRDETLSKSRPIPGIDGNALYLFPLSNMKILYERKEGEILGP